MVRHKIRIDPLQAGLTMMVVLLREYRSYILKIRNEDSLTIKLLNKITLIVMIFFKIVKKITKEKIYLKYIIKKKFFKIEYDRLIKTVKFTLIIIIN